MKTTNALFLTKQAKAHISDEFYVYLFEQWDYAITDRTDATHIKIQGDASSWLSSGDVFIIPLDDFDTYHTLTSSPSYDGGSNKTTITCSGSSFGAGVVGLHVALRHDITGDVLKDGISNIRITTEGETLNSSLADDVQIAVNNADQSYWDSDGSSGLFNTGRVFWIQIIFKLADDSTEFLYFGGLVYLPSIQPIANLQNVEFVCNGHLKELERYPGWYAAAQVGTLSIITGIEAIQVIEPSAGAYENRKKLKYIFPDKIDIVDLNILFCWYNLPLGWHIIRFQPPDLWQFDYGAWTQETAGDTSVELTGDHGSGITIDLPGVFDVVAREDIFWVETLGKPIIKNLGKASLQFDEGPIVQIKHDFEMVLRYDATAAAYYAITREVCFSDIDEVDAIEAENDIIYIMSPRQFYGIDFELNTDLDGTLTWYYSTKYNGWSTLTKTDGTSNFAQDGTVTWERPGNWIAANQEINSVAYDQYFIIKIVCTSYTSGTAQIKRALRYLRLYGQDGTILDVKAKLEALPIENREEEILLVENSSGDLESYIYQQNMSFQDFLENLLDNAQYNSGYRNLDNLVITTASSIISMYGRPPFHYYSKKVTAITVDTSTSPETVYLGVEDELWKVDEVSGFTFIDKLDLYHKSSLTGDERFIRCEIFRLKIDGNGYLQGMAVQNYESVYDANDPDIDKRRAAIVFRSTNLTAITEQNQFDNINYSIFTDMRRCFRDGNYDAANKRAIGQDSGEPMTCGENVILPFPQMVNVLNPPPFAGLKDMKLYSIGSLTGNSPSASYLDIWNDHPDMYYLRTPGYFYTIQNTDGGGDPGNLCFRFNLGQKGFCVWNENQDAWYFLFWDSDDGDYYIAKVIYDGTVTQLYDCTSMANQIMCGDYTSDYVYYALFAMVEDGSNFPADLCDCEIRRVSSDGLTNNQMFDFAADSVEANQSLSGGDEPYCVVLDLIYNAYEGTLHGCLLNRNDMQYHYFVLNISGGNKLYTTQTGTGFTFDAGRQIKELIYNDQDYKVYAVVVDTRFEEKTAYLISANWTPPGNGADGTEITLTFEAEIKANEWDCVQLGVGLSNRIYGITRPNNFYLWQYDNNFYPRFFLGKTEDKSYRDIIENLAQAINMIISIQPNRYLNFIDRDTETGSTTIYEETNYLSDSMGPLKIWQHKYDGIEISWENPFTGERGVERSGEFGWQRRILKINNPFIQYPQLAKVIADVYYDFFADYRMQIEFGVYPLWQLDNRDKFQFSHSVNHFDFATATWWLIEELIYNFFNGEMKVKALEI
jgi:hypothetical protein